MATPGLGGGGGRPSRGCPRPGPWRQHRRPSVVVRSTKSHRLGGVRCRHWLPYVATIHNCLAIRGYRTTTRQTRSRTPSPLPTTNAISLARPSHSDFSRSDGAGVWAASASRVRPFAKDRFDIVKLSVVSHYLQRRQTDADQGPTNAVFPFFCSLNLIEARPESRVLGRRIR